MMWLYIAAAIIGGALLGAALTRWTGSGEGRLGTGRLLSAALIALSVFLQDWLLGLAVFALTWRAKSLPHGDGLNGSKPFFMADTGLMLTGFAALAELALGRPLWAVLYAVAGLAKGLTYLLPEGTRTTGRLKGRFIWKELALGAVVFAVAGGAVGAAL